MLPNNRCVVPTPSIFHSTQPNEIGTTYLRLKPDITFMQRMSIVQLMMIELLYERDTRNKWNVKKNFHLRTHLTTAIILCSLLFHLPNEFKKSVIRLILVVMTSMYSRLAQSWWICFWIASRWTPAIILFVFNSIDSIGDGLMFFFGLSFVYAGELSKGVQRCHLVIRTGIYLVVWSMKNALS